MFILMIIFNNVNIDLFNLFIENSVLNNSDIILICGFIPLKIYDNLANPVIFRSYLHKIGGVYGLVNISNPTKIKQYIGSSKDLYHRLLDHLKGRD